MPLPFATVSGVGEVYGSPIQEKTAAACNYLPAGFITVSDISIVVRIKTTYSCLFLFAATIVSILLTQAE